MKRFKPGISSAERRRLPSTNFLSKILMNLNRGIASKTTLAVAVRKSIKNPICESVKLIFIPPQFNMYIANTGPKTRTRWPINEIKREDENPMIPSTCCWTF